MKPITLIATDLDGTLLDDKKEVTNTTRTILKQLKQQGILFGVATGRPVESTLILSKEWGLDEDLSFMIGMNGGIIYDVRQQEKEEFHLMNGETILEIIEHFKDMNVLFHVMVGNHRYTNLSTPETLEYAELFGEVEIEIDLSTFLIGKKVNKLIIYLLNPEEMDDVKQRASTFSSELYTSFQTAPRLYEYVHPSINKGFGIKKVCEHFGICLENVAAFGDAQNDKEMLQIVGMGVAMKNACDEIKEVADFVSEFSNKENGMARFIEQYIMEQKKEVE